MSLPVDFQKKMQQLLQEDYDAFLASYQEKSVQGLRVNTLKISIDTFQEISPFTLQPIPWVKSGFFYDDPDRPGKHPYHEAGLYYIQEPSAMAVAEFVDPKPGEKVLDLCAAPGGKSTHLAAKMNQQGLLIANEIHPARAKILSQNIERLGIKNAMVTNESPERLASRFPGFFDRILVDAPCSGEGMFRKDESARDEWSLRNVELCAVRQIDILHSAAVMLRPGGRLVYSTCTFSPEENEGVIHTFLKEYPEFQLVEVQPYKEFSKGRADWIEEATEDIKKTIRIWPHKTKGEGHFIAVLEKVDGEVFNKRMKQNSRVSPKLLQDYKKFVSQTLTIHPEGAFLLFGDHLYIVPEGVSSLEKIKVVRPGWHLGTIKKNRFEPSHALALSLRKEEVQEAVHFDKDSAEVYAYLRGETVSVDAPQGWVLVTVDGYSLGWGKVVNGMMKNHYPNGLRWQG